MSEFVVLWDVWGGLGSESHRFGFVSSRGEG